MAIDYNTTPWLALASQADPKVSMEKELEEEIKKLQEQAALNELSALIQPATTEQPTQRPETKMIRYEEPKRESVPPISNPLYNSPYDAADTGMAEQLKGIKSLEDLVGQYKAREPQMDLSPLMALSDTWFGGNLSKNYRAPQTPDERQKAIIAIENELQKRRGDVAKPEMALLKTMMTQANRQDTASARDQRQDKALDFRQVQTDQRAHDKVLTRLKDPKLGASLGMYNQLERGLDILEKADVRNPELIEEAQQLIKGAMGLAGRSGVHERERTVIRRFDDQVARLQQYFTGRPTDVPNQKALLDHIKKIAKVEMANIKKNHESRLKALTSGHKSVYDRNPELQDDLNDAIEAYSSQLLSEPEPTNQSAPASQPGQPKLSDELRKRIAALEAEGG